jgi:carbon storage regulator
MLVLTRKPGEQLVVPNCELVVTVIAIKGKRVRLGICAPESQALFRGEVWQRLHPEEHDPRQAIHEPDKRQSQPPRD